MRKKTINYRGIKNMEDKSLNSKQSFLYMNETLGARLSLSSLV